MGNIFSRKCKSVALPHISSEALLYVANAQLIDFPYGFKHLVLEGGGVKVVAFVGALKVMEVSGILKHIHDFAGTSAGALLAAILAMGYTIDEILAMVKNMDFARFKDNSSVGILGDSVGLLSNYGMCSGAVFCDWFSTLISRKFEQSDLTFQQLFERTQNTLVVTTANANSGRTVYLSRHTHPQLSIITAVRMSISIPFFFTPVKYDGDYYVDGGLFDNYPIYAFDNEVPGDKQSTATLDKMQTIGLKFAGSNDGAIPRERRKRKINSVLEYGMALINGTLEEIARLRLNQDDYTRTILVPTLGHTTMDFGISGKQRLELFVCGSLAAQSFLANWVKRHQRRPSLAAYFRPRRSSADQDEKRERIRLMRHLSRHNDSIFGPIFSSTDFDVEHKSFACDLSKIKEAADV